MRSVPKPIVAAVNGPAAGVGMSFALAADIAIAAQVGELPAGLRPHRPAARRRQHLVPAAPGRRAAGARARHAGAQDQRRAGQGMGPDLGRRRGRRADEDGDRGGARPGRRPDLVARAHQGGDEPRLGQPAQPAARPRARLPARARPQRGFPGGRVRPSSPSASPTSRASRGKHDDAAQGDHLGPEVPGRARSPCPTAR